VLFPARPALPRKFRTSGFFEHSLRPGLLPPLGRWVGNAVTVVGTEEDTSQPTMLARELAALADLPADQIPAIISVADAVAGDPRWVGFVVALWVSGRVVDELGEAVQRARALGLDKPIVAYLDARGWPGDRPAWLGDDVWPSLQCYPGPAESAAVFKAEVGGDVQRVQGYGRPFWLTVRADDSGRGAAGVADALAVFPVVDGWARDLDLGVMGLHYFAIRRQGGAAAHAALLAWVDGLSLANPLRPGRFDGWRPETVSRQEKLRNILGQQVWLRTVDPDDAAYLLDLVNADDEGDGGGGGEPPADPDLDHLLRDRTPLVRQLRHELSGLGDDDPWPGEEHAFRLTAALAWTLREEGWGLVAAKAGSANNVQGYTADAIAQPDGEHVDVISATGEHNGALWDPVRYRDGWEQAWNDAIAPRWRPPINPDDLD
jgi:hypothetical protein